MTSIRFRTIDELYDAAVDTFERLAEAAIRARRRFTVALSGGATPIPLFDRLAARPTAIAWESVCVFWSDERCVAPDDARSNVRLAQQHLLDRVPVLTGNVHRIEAERPPLEAADAYEIVVRRTLAGGGRLDLLLLGIGADGHTASLFPRHQALSEADRWILPVHVPADPPWRITMTLPLINAARNILVLAVGDDKLAALKQIERGEDLPAGRVRPTDGRLTWLIAEDDGSGA